MSDLLARFDALPLAWQLAITVLLVIIGTALMAWAASHEGRR